MPGYVPFCVFFGYEPLALDYEPFFVFFDYEPLYEAVVQAANEEAERQVMRLA